MKSVNPNLVFCQYLSNLPRNILACPIYNYDAKLLTDLSIVKVFIMANLCKCESLQDIASMISSQRDFQKEIGVKSFSRSQLSRRLAQLNTGHLADLLTSLAVYYWQLKGDEKGIDPNVGLVRIIDGTYVKLPMNVADWAAISPTNCGIKLHVRISVADADSVFPEKMIPSTGNVADSDAVNHIIEADDALYIMDRGYAHKTKMGGWMEKNVQFLVRCRKDFRMETTRSFKPSHPQVVKNEFVSILTREENLRYIHFKDQKGTDFHLLTNRLDLTEEEILDAYKSRWYIELFFKWLKQHVKVRHLFSHAPTGIWNQMYIALITVALIKIMRLQVPSNKDESMFLSLFKGFLFKKMYWFKKVLKPSDSKSKGRQKIPKKPKKPPNFGEDYAIVNPTSCQEYATREKEKKRKKKEREQKSNLNK